MNDSNIILMEKAICYGSPKALAGDSADMQRPYLGFRPTAELQEEIASIGASVGLTNADIVRQLCLKGLEDYHEGRISFNQPVAARRNKGGPDRRYLRQSGEKGRMKKSGKKKVGDSATPRSVNPLPKVQRGFSNE